MRVGNQEGGLPQTVAEIGPRRTNMGKDRPFCAGKWLSSHAMNDMECLQEKSHIENGLIFRMIVS